MEPVYLTIPADLFDVAQSASFQGECSLDVLKSGPDLYTFPEPLTWEVTLSNTGEALLVMGTVEGRAQTSCARCLETFELSIFGEVETLFLFDADCALAAELDEDEYEILPEGNRIDVAPHLLAGILLDVPLIPLCKDDCAGLCLECGANLNEETCSCNAAVPIEQDKDEETQGELPKQQNAFAALRDYEF